MAYTAPLMAASSSLATSVAASIPLEEVSSPATSNHEVDEQEQEIYTIHDLLRAGANGETTDEPIVVYPSKEIDYAYYTPRQVCAPSHL
jgi:hypothetical protein